MDAPENAFVERHQGLICVRKGFVRGDFGADGARSTHFAMFARVELAPSNPFRRVETARAGTDQPLSRYERMERRRRSTLFDMSKGRVRTQFNLHRRPRETFSAFAEAAFGPRWGGDRRRQGLDHQCFPSERSVSPPHVFRMHRGQGPSATFSPVAAASTPTVRAPFTVDALGAVPAPAA